MWLLYDAVLPQSLADEARSLDLQRWDGPDVTDEELVRFVSQQGGRGVLFLGRDSLEQPDLRRLASELGVALIAAATDDPIEAKRRIIKNRKALRRLLDSHDCVLVLSNEVRPAPQESSSLYRTVSGRRGRR